MIDVFASVSLFVILFDNRACIPKLASIAFCVQISLRKARKESERACNQTRLERERGERKTDKYSLTPFKQNNRTINTRQHKHAGNTHMLRAECAKKNVFLLSESQKVGKGESFFSLITEKNSRNVLPLFRVLNKVSNLLDGN